MAVGNEISKLNNQDHDVSVIFFNGIKEIVLRSTMITDLVIEEDFVDWPTKGYITVENQQEFFERLPKSPEGFPSIEGLDYKYRGDGRDAIWIGIQPNLDQPGPDGASTQPLKPDVWRFEHKFFIYDVEDLPDLDTNNKRKTFYFWDREYQILLEKNIEFTTANVGSNKGQTNIHELDNYERSLPSGEALLEYFKAVEELKTQVPEETGELWSRGSEDKNTVFYTSPSNFKGIDDVNALKELATSDESENFDMCFLRLNRADDSGIRKFSFEPLSKYLEKAGTDSPGDYQLDRFLIMEPNESEETVIVHKSPTGDENTNKNIRAAGRNEVLSYQFEEMGGYDSGTYIVNKPVHSYNLAKGQFNIDIVDHTPEKSIEYQKENYLNKIGPESKPRLHLNNFKKEGYALTNVFGFGYKEARLAYGRNKILKSGLFQNQGSTLMVPGSTCRQAGRFFSIYKSTFNDTKFDDTLEGQYLTLRVIHHFKFQDQLYRNELYGVKMHRFRSENETPEDDTEILNSGSGGEEASSPFDPNNDPSFLETYPGTIGIV